MTAQKNKRGIRSWLLYHSYCRERFWQDQGGCRWRSHLEGKAEGSDTVGMPIYLFSGHKLVDIEEHT